jgi:tRNA 2-thiouridine synthesizing protein A
MSEYGIDEVMDVTGLYCPEPVMMLHSKMGDIETGQVLEVLATDPSTTRDIPKFCHFLGHELLQHGEREQLYFYHIRKN